MFLPGLRCSCRTVLTLSWWEMSAVRHKWRCVRNALPFQARSITQCALPCSPFPRFHWVLSQGSVCCTERGDSHLANFVWQNLRHEQLFKHFQAPYPKLFSSHHCCWKAAACSWSPSSVFYLKAPNGIEHVKQPEFYYAKCKALWKLQLGKNIIRIIEIGKRIWSAKKKSERKGIGGIAW